MERLAERYVNAANATSSLCICIYREGRRTRRPPKTDGAHVCRPRSIFFAAHVAEENDWTFFHRTIGKSLRGFLASSYSVLHNGDYFFTFWQKFIRIVATCWRAALPCGSR